MSEKRRDNKNRILRSGESQRKDGRYAYKYTDTFGKVQFVYAWLKSMLYYYKQLNMVRIGNAQSSGMITNNT